jgi:hypothetical protein
MINFAQSTCVHYFTFDPYFRWTPKEPNDMEFTLVYEGPLLGASRADTRASHKHDVRKQFHPQLRELWSRKFNFTGGAFPPLGHGWVSAESLGVRFSRCGYKFVPLVTEDLVLACAIDILFLRRDTNRRLLYQGDIDNRLKTLFDALRIPQDCQELGGQTPTPDEDPFYCLLEDDKLITEVRVATDTLLTPLTENEGQNHAQLIIAVKLRPTQLKLNNMQFA